MKTRIVRPILWVDTRLSGLSITTKLLFCYLTSNQFLGLTRYVQIADRQILFDTGLNTPQLKKAKNELSTVGLVLFSDGWIYQNHNLAYVDYEGRDRVMESKQEELNAIPKEIKEVFKGLITGYKPVLNHKSKTIKHKSKTINQELKKEKYENEHTKLIEAFNNLFGKNISSSRAWAKNYALARESYTYDQIEEAIRVGKDRKWWGFKSDPNLQLVFRRSNKKGDCDYIDEMRNLDSKEKKFDPNQSEFKSDKEFLDWTKKKKAWQDKK